MFRILPYLFLFFVMQPLAALAGPVDPFPLKPAPLWENVEGTWQTTHTVFPMYFKFCRLRNGAEGQLKIQLARSSGPQDNNKLRYLEVGFGDSANRSVNFAVSDPRLGGRVKVRVRSYFLEDNAGEVVLRLEAMRNLIEPETRIVEFLMVKISQERPGHCPE